MAELIPTILVHSKDQLKKELAMFGPLFKTAQLDIMDGRFVDNKTVQPSAFKGMKTKLVFEAHLMVEHPLKHIKVLSTIKRVKRILFHYEGCDNDQEVIDAINFCREKKLQVGLAINPTTKVKKIEHFIPVIDAVLVMGVTPGWSGQRFKPSTIKKFKDIRKHSKTIKLQFDGGANEKTIKSIVKAGAQRIAVHSVLLKSGNISQAKRELSKLIKN